mmetsp:Transcript_1158/g.1471  ORF Transcript_1158/g.1471 Transcript_1158/m.1471 type:complete len:250 (+) Transcript_1158:189-938(+)
MVSKSKALLKRIGKKVRWRKVDENERTNDNVSERIFQGEENTSQKWSMSGTTRSEKDGATSSLGTQNATRSKRKVSRESVSQATEQSSESRDDDTNAGLSFYVTKAEESTGDTITSESVDLNKVRRFYSDDETDFESFSFDSRDSMGRRKTMLRKIGEGISYRIYSCQKAVARAGRACVEECYGGYLDCTSGCDQVCNAFTLKEKEINAVHSRLEKANTHFDRRVETLPALVEFESPPLGMKCRLLNIC